jgi:serine/threonine-protein kinase HipA
MKLAVLLEGKYLADAYELENGRCAIEYDENILTLPKGELHLMTPISTTMPISEKRYTTKTVAPYLAGLLPDNQMDKNNIRRKYQVSSDLQMLYHIGLDVAGAIQFCPHDQLNQAISRPRILRKLRKKEFNDVIVALSTADRTPPIGVSMSLAGNQAKTALQLGMNGNWYWPEGAEPSTHIIKPGIGTLSNQAANEFLCMKVADLLELQAAEIAYSETENTPIIIIKRFDRYRNEDGLICRIHQEDFCQALKKYPFEKYASDGGSSAIDIINCIRKVSAKDIVNSNIRGFIDGLFFNYLIGAPDGHSKNYSLLLSQNKVIFAPLYDIASGYPYKNNGKLAYPTAAMSIGQKNRFGTVKYNALIKFADAAKLNPDEIQSRFKYLSDNLPDAISEIATKYGNVPGVKALAKEILSEVRRYTIRW